MIKQKHKLIGFLIVLFLLSRYLMAQDITLLNQKERNWLAEHPAPLRVGITMIPNQVLTGKKGEYSGFSIDLFKMIEKQIGRPFAYVYFQRWDALIDAARKKQIDIIFSAQKTPSRLSYLDFTDTVLVQQNKIIVNIDNDRFTSISSLFGHRVAVTSGSAIEEFLRYNYPQLKIVKAEDELEVLRLVSMQKADAAVSELVRASYYMKQYDLGNLRIAGDLGYDYHLRIASRRDQPMLNVILSKIVSALPQDQIDALRLKWGYIKDEVVFFDKQMMIYIALVFGTILPFSFYLYRVNRRLEREIVSRKEALEKVVKMRRSRLNQMSEIISMIAHQWKQPLNNLSLFNMQIILKYQKGKLDDEAIKYFQENSQKQIALMSSTINDFKDFFKVEEEKRCFNVTETIENLLNILSPVFQKDEIVIDISYDTNSAYKVIGYSNALLQILLNIVNNAKDALIEKKDAGDRRIAILLYQEEEHVIISIEDNAGGIPDEIIDRVFDPYFSTKKKNGTGLGLYMAKTILEEQMEGYIDVQNSAKGALFTIRLKKHN